MVAILAIVIVAAVVVVEVMVCVVAMGLGEEMGVGARGGRVRMRRRVRTGVVVLVVKMMEVCTVMEGRRRVRGGGHRGDDGAKRDGDDEEYGQRQG